MVFMKVDYSTDKPEVDGARILFPISAPFYGYLKLLKLHKLEGCEIWGSSLRPPAQRPLTNLLVPSLPLIWLRYRLDKVCY